MSRSRLIAIDYDDTYTADPCLWDLFIDLARLSGHRIVCVTARRDTDENHDAVKIGAMGVPVIFTALEAKKAFCERNGLKVDIWIDDNPHAVINGF